KQFNRTIIWSISLAFVGLVFSCYTSKPMSSEFGNEHHKNNLKVLPKDISHDNLMAIMHSYEKSLGYTCGDCHAKSKKNPEKIDFASDENHKKKVVLNMMKRVKKLNKKQFAVKGDFTNNYLYCRYYVTCVTCHQGKEIPPYHIP